MKSLMKRSLALLIAFVLIISLVPSSVFTASAAAYIHNWGTREKLATELSDMAEAWYDKYSTSYAELSALSGSSSTGSVPSSALYKELKTLMTNAHSTKTSYDGTKELYRYTDCQNGGGMISSFYSGTSIGPGWGEGGSWNREHTWPNSKGLGGQDENDIMMLRPTSTAENSSRGNTAYGQSSGYYHPNSESDGKYDLRGDCARICLYVYVRWGNTGYMWGQSGVMESKEVLLEWMEEDPVDTWELGRNDSVQSITGTRNVFVDYPELAFDLFEADIPAGYDTPSGSGAYTITAQSNNTSYGTVSVSGKTITAYPKTGYQVSGYKVVSGSATVTQSGNVFTVSATDDCTIQILFTPRTQVSVTFIDRGVTQSAQSVYSGDSITLPACASAAPNGFTFCGWVTQRITESESKPSIYGANSAYKVDSAATFYALYAKLGEGDSIEPVYTLVTDASQLTEGASVVITASGTTALAMKSTGGTNNRYSGSITKNSDNTISFADKDLIDVLTLGNGVNAGTYSFFSEANGQYLAAGTNSGSNVLKMQSSLDSAASFSVAVNANGVATVISQTSSDRNMLRYNSSANVFACYASGQKDISLYVCSGGGVLYYTTNPVTCTHDNTSAVAATPASCTESGFTAGVFCNDCQNYISGHEVITALGHSMDAGVVTTPATCTEAGVKTYTCGTCGTKKTESIPAAGHDFDTGKITTPATCTQTGVKTYTCQTCGTTKAETVSATDHSYDDGVVTAPTATEQGYTTYTCTVCGHSYQDHFTDATGLVYKVSFKVPYGVTPVADMSCNKFGITLPDAGIPVGDYEYTFAGWVTSAQEDSEQQPELLEAGDTYYATQNITLYALYTYTVGGTGNAEYTLTDIADIDSTDSVVITMTYTDGTVYAMNNDNGTGDAPDGIIISAANGKLTSEPAENLMWNVGGTEGAYVFYPNGSTTTWLYCTSTNNGVRVGTNANKTFYIDDATGYLRNKATNRYVGVFRGKPDWRCYTSQTTNIGDQTLGFYVKGEVGTTYFTTVITNSCPHESYENGFCTDCGIPEPVLVEKWNLSLEDDLKVNFHLNVQSEDQVKITVADQETVISASEMEQTEDGKYVATVAVNAAQMTDSIIIEVVGKESSDPMTYTVRQYADTILEDASQSQYHALVKEMLNYGGKAQVYFDHNANNLANAGVTGVEAENVPESTTELSVTGTAAGISFYAASLVYRDKVALRFYFKTTAETVASCTFTANGISCDPVQKGEYYYIEVSGITPDKLDQQITVAVTGTDGTMSSVSYSPMNYIVRMSAKGSDSLKALLKALYNYHLAAKNI